MSVPPGIRAVARRTYAVDEYAADDVTVLLHSSPASTSVLLDAGRVGAAFSSRLQEAALSAWDAATTQRGKPDLFNWTCIMRGGLSFLPWALPAAPTSTISFIGMSRLEDRLEVDYERLNLVADVPCVISDIVATGGTMCTAMELLASALAPGAKLPEIVIVGVVAREGLIAVVEAFRRLAPALGAEHLTVVALEAIFDLPATPDSDRRIGRQDFLRQRGPVCPEYAQRWLESPRSWFERCAVYDGGRRAFEPTRHEDEMASHWRWLACLTPLSAANDRCGPGLSPLHAFGRWAGDPDAPQEAFARFVSQVLWPRFCELAPGEAPPSVTGASGPPRSIDKVAFVCVRDGRVLSTRSHGKEVFYIPGGKREGGESDLDTLEREIREELTVAIRRDTARHIGTYRAQAHGHKPGIDVVMRCYEAEVDGEFEASSEIAEVVWLTSADADRSSAVDRLILADLAAQERIR